MLAYLNLGFVPRPDEVICRYRVTPEEGSTLEEAAEKMAGESSIGTWTDISTMNEKIAQKLKPKIFEVNPAKNEVKIAYPLDLFELGNISEILSSIAGNIYGMKAVARLKLLDIRFPEAMVKSFPGPAFGIQGIRDLTKIYDRPLLGTIIKPKVGLDEEQHSKVAYEAWIGGLDIVKDDENLSSMTFNNFYQRMDLTFKMRAKAEQETGKKKIYLANITASDIEEMLKRAEYVKKLGGEYIMVDIITIGWTGLHSLRKKDLGLIFHAHRAGYAALTRIPDHGISMLVLAKICRLLGMDQLHIGTANVGKMEGAPDEVLEIEENIEKEETGENLNGYALGQKWYGMKPVLAVASGGLHPGHLPELVKLMDRDIVAQFGGGCHGHPDGTRSGASAIVQAAEAVCKNIPLEEYAKDHEELKKALETWTSPP